MSLELSKKALAIKPSSTLAITDKAKALRAQGLDVVSFSVGEPDFDTPEHIRQAAIDAIHQGYTRYTPAAGLPQLRKAVTEKLRRDNGLEYDWKDVVISNGGKHALINAFLAILNPGDEVIIPAPYWLSYSEMVRIAGGTPVILRTKKEDGFMVNWDELEMVATPKTKALILTSPSNPTGMIYGWEDLESIARFANLHDIFIISDEIYEKLIYTGQKHISIASFGPETKRRTIVVNGLSKSYAMTGWRIGYTAAPPEVSKVIASLQSHMTSNPHSVAQMAALAALTGPQDCVEEMRLEFKKRCEYIYEREEAIPLISAWKPEGAFYLFVDISKTIGKKYRGASIGSAADFARLLLDYKLVALIPCEDFGMGDHIRISYACSMEDIKKGMDRLEEFVNELE